MDIAAIFEKAASIAWRRRSLWMLGFAYAALTGGELFGKLAEGPVLESLNRIPEINSIPYWPELPPGLITLRQVGDALVAINNLGVLGWIGIFTALAVILIAVGVAVIIDFGAMIVAGSDQRDGTLVSSLCMSLRRFWPMVVIASVPAIPITIGAIIWVLAAWGMVASSGGIDALSQNSGQVDQVLVILYAAACILLCPLSIITIALQWLAGLAYRACMLDGLNAVESFRIAWNVLRANFGSAVLVGVLSLAVGVVAGLVSEVPSNLFSVFLPAVVLIWLVQGAARIFLVTLWTVVWQSWTAPPENKGGRA